MRVTASEEERLADSMERSLVEAEVRIRYAQTQQVQHMGFQGYITRTKHGFIPVGTFCFVKRSGLEYLDAYFGHADLLRLKHPQFADNPAMLRWLGAVPTADDDAVNENILKLRRFVTNTFYILGQESPAIVVYKARARPF